MKIRIMGTLAELEFAKKYYVELEKQPHIVAVQISEFYPNRGSNTIFRLYVDVTYNMQKAVNYDTTRT